MSGRWLFLLMLHSPSPKAQKYTGTATAETGINAHITQPCKRAIQVLIFGSDVSNLQIGGTAAPLGVRAFTDLRSLLEILVVERSNSES